jgi:hypothetical protein
MSLNTLHKLPLLYCAVLAALVLLAAAYSPALAQEPAGGESPDAVLDQNALRVNEVMAANKKTLTDPDEPGETPDWLELYNPGPEDVTLNGLGLADGDPIETGFAIADGITIPAGRFIVFYADGDVKQGPLHTNFGLSADGESVILYRVATKEIIDRIDFPAMQDDQAYGRKPDGSGNVLFLPAASPGQTNSINPPDLSDLTKPPYPAPVNAAIPVSVTAVDNGTVANVKLYYTLNSGATQVLPMQALGSNVYAASIPGQPAATLVTYYAQAVDNEGETARTPLVGRERRYLTGYVAPVLLINEVVVDNSDQYVDPDEPAETPDWIELYNPGPGSVSLNGMSLTDDNDAPLRFVIPDGLTLGAGERMMFLADDDKGQNTLRGNQPPLHLPFNLNKSNEFIGLYGGQGTVRIDFYDVDAELPFGIAARIPDGGKWSTSVCASFGGANYACDSRVFAPSVNR